MQLLPIADTNRLFNQLPEHDPEKLEDSLVCLLRETDRNQLNTLCLAVLPVLMRAEFSGRYQDELYPDMTSVAAERIIRSVDTWIPGKGMNITSWCYLNAKHAVLKFIRKETNWRKFTVDTDDFDGDTGTMLDTSDRAYGEKEGRTERQLFWEALFDSLCKTVTAEQREILELLLEGFTYQEIADILGFSRTTISRRVAKLQQLLHSRNK